MSVDDDDKPTVVLDLNALKKQKLKQEEDLANIGQELEFAVGPEDKAATSAPKTIPDKSLNTDEYAEAILANRPETSAPKASPQKTNFKVILFDFQSDFFQKSVAKFPKGYDYQIAKDLPALNKFLSEKSFQIVVFNYDVSPKAVNQLTAQIKQKFPHTKTMIMAKAISPEKAKMHAKTASGANGYYQYPLDAKKIESELQKIHSSVKKVG